MTWVMPAETAPQDRVWMAFPVSGATLGSDADGAEEARATWTAVAHAVLEHEPVGMVVDPGEVEVARRFLSAEVDVVVAPLDDFWMRDIGPTFVIDDAKPDARRLGAVDWVFNAWGAQPGAAWRNDSRIAAAVADAAGAVRIPSLLVNEGGGMHVDGAGTVIVTQTVQLDPGRNPYLDRDLVEAELFRTIGGDRIVWLPRGLTRDYEALGTRGHVDMVATIASPGALLLHSQRDPSHPDFAVMRELRAALEDELPGWSITELAAPSILRDADGFVDYNYVNHLVVNGGVIAGSFGDDRADAAARDLLAGAYPGRAVTTVDARPIFARGGGIHCITQQQPRLAP